MGGSVGKHEGEGEEGRGEAEKKLKRESDNTRK